MGMDEPEEVLRPAEQRDDAPGGGQYEVSVRCGNCSARDDRRLDRGTAIREVACTRCGVVGELHPA
jgi:hypothetical protein